MKQLLAFLICLGMLFLPGVSGATSISLGFSSLPSSQSPSGLDWTYQGDTPESSVFNVGLNGNNEKALFQDSIGLGATVHGYELLNQLDPSLKSFNVDWRVAVLQEESLSNHFGFGLFINYEGRYVTLGFGTSVIQVVDSTGYRILSSTLDNTEYHDYVLNGDVGAGNMWSLYRDSELIGQGSFASYSGNRIFLGDQSAGANARTEVTRFSFSQPAPIPEPTTMLLLGSGIIGLAGFRRKFMKR